MGWTLDDVLITDELAGRPRAPDYALEARALGRLADYLTKDPGSLLEAVVELSVVVCRGHSAGVSMLEPGHERNLFRWHALSGPFAKNVGGTMPEDASPCGDVIRRNQVLLFDRPDRFFPALVGVTPTIYEALLAPWHLHGEPVATLWVLAHSPERHFDAEDARLLGSLARVAAAAWQFMLVHKAATQEATAVVRQTEERLRLIVESLRDYAVVSTDIAGVITTWNEGAVRLFGYPAREAIGQPASILYPPEDRDAGHPMRELRKAADLGRAEYEHWQVRKGGRRVHVSGVITPLRFNGDVSGFVKVARDTTERQRRDESLQQSHDELEVRVQQRTIELTEAANRLQVEIRDRQAAESRIKGLFTRLVTAQEDERRRISREIHDQIGQQITALRMNLETVRQHCHSDPRAAEHAERTIRLAQTLDANIEYLTWDLRPLALDHFGLRAALDAMVRDWSERFGLTAEYHDVGFDAVRLSDQQETQLYRIAQEALHNVIRHADASTVAVVLERAGDQVTLMVEDNGCGFDPDGSATARAGMGLLGMRERANLINGELQIESSPGSGTTVYVRVSLSRAG